MDGIKINRIIIYCTGDRSAGLLGGEYTLTGDSPIYEDYSDKQRENLDEFRLRLEVFFQELLDEPVSIYFPEIDENPLEEEER